jgi:hypothetical protein
VRFALATAIRERPAGRHAAATVTQPAGPDVVSSSGGSEMLTLITLFTLAVVGMMFVVGIVIAAAILKLAWHLVLLPLKIILLPIILILVLVKVAVLLVVVGIVAAVLIPLLIVGLVVASPFLIASSFA